MDARLTLPILLLMIAVSLAGAIDASLRPVDDAFRLSPLDEGGLGGASFALSGPIGTSPALRWAGTPEGTRSLVLFGEDLDAPADQRVFWRMNIAAEIRQLEPGQGFYQPPTWRATATHRLRFTLLALSSAPPRNDVPIAELQSSALGGASWYTGGGWVF